MIMKAVRYASPPASRLSTMSVFSPLIFSLLASTMSMQETSVQLQLRICKKLDFLASREHRLLQGLKC